MSWLQIPKKSYEDYKFYPFKKWSVDIDNGIMNGIGTTFVAPESDKDYKDCKDESFLTIRISTDKTTLVDGTIYQYIDGIWSDVIKKAHGHHYNKWSGNWNEILSGKKCKNVSYYYQLPNQFSGRMGGGVWSIYILDSNNIFAKNDVLDLGLSCIGKLKKV